MRASGKIPAPSGRPDFSTSDWATAHSWKNRGEAHLKLLAAKPPFGEVMNEKFRLGRLCPLVAGSRLASAEKSKGHSAFFVNAIKALCLAAV